MSAAQVSKLSLLTGAAADFDAACRKYWVKYSSLRPQRLYGTEDAYEAYVP